MLIGISIGIACAMIKTESSESIARSQFDRASERAQFEQALARDQFEQALARVGYIFLGAGIGAMIDHTRAMNRIQSEREEKADELKINGHNCTICSNPFENNNYILPCHHRFHYWCIENWFWRGSRKCPICKKYIRSIELSYICSANVHAGEQLLFNWNSMRDPPNQTFEYMKYILPIPLFCCWSAIPLVVCLICYYFNICLRIIIL